MNYYESIKQELINNEIYKKIKDYSKNKNDLKTYYNVGKMLSDAGKQYGVAIIKSYSDKLTIEVGKKYNERTLRRMRQFYNFYEKWSTVSTELTWSHYAELLSLLDVDKINYYKNICIQNNLSIRELRNKIKSNEYERLDSKTKLKIKEDNKLEIQDFIKNPIILKTNVNKEKITEKILHQLILENIDEFLKELGNGFTYVGNEYKIKIGNRYNYIDFLLFNYIYNCFVVIELKITELKKEHIGQIETYMNYIDKNIKELNQDKTIGIIICKRGNEFIMEYCSDSRIFNTTYELV